MSEQGLTQAQLDRQDEVDAVCFNFILQLSGEQSTDAGGKIEWDMETIQAVREAVQEVIVDKLHLMTEMEFYPYIENEDMDEAGNWMGKHKGKSTEQLQSESDKVYAWLKTTSEPFDNWEYDGKELTVYHGTDKPEVYKRDFLAKQIPDLNQGGAK